MATHVGEIELRTQHRGLYSITDEVAAHVARSGIRLGLVNVFVAHTSASLVITENADPDVLADLERWFADSVRDGDSRFAHDAEGPDDMSAHLRSVLTQTSVSVPVRDGQLALGVWQGIYVWEHRFRGHRRAVLITVVGDR